MSVNKYYFKLPTTNQTLDIPIELTWDFLGKQDSIEKYEEETVNRIIGTAIDFELSRFSHEDWSPQNQNTSVLYDFRFYSSGGTSVTATTSGNTNLWKSSYLAEGFNSSEIYYFSNPFKKSFFKLDFYDTNDNKTQQNFFTIIIPTQQGFTETANVSGLLSSVKIKKPVFKLDWFGDKEGFFIYWLNKRNYVNLDTFYMSAKFFDAKLGVFVKMMIRPQSELPSKFLFDGDKLFYYKVFLDYEKKTYKIFDSVDINRRVGTILPVLWYEYVNP
jgi:hypothetical protein